MKISGKASITPSITQEEQIEQTLRLFIQAGLVDSDAVLACLAKEFMGVGVGEQGLADSLEGVRPLLANRVKNENGVDYSVEYRNMHIRSGVFMMLDVDHFKDINDTYGHPFGDTVLTDAARSTAERFRAHDIIGRLGGDEFCIFYCGMLSRKRMEEAVQESVTCSINCMFPKQGTQPRRAALALP